MQEFQDYERIQKTKAAALEQRTTGKSAVCDGVQRSEAGALKCAFIAKDAFLLCSELLPFDNYFRVRRSSSIIRSAPLSSIRKWR